MIKMIFTWVLFTVLLCGTTFEIHAASSWDRKIREQKLALKKLKDELQEQRNQIKEIKTQEQGVLNTISLLEQNIGSTREFLDKLQGSQRNLELSIKAYRKQIDSLSVVLDEQKKMMNFRIRKLYMKGSPLRNQLQVLIGGSDNVYRRLVYVRSLLRADRELVERVKNTRDEIDQRQRQLNNRISELQAMKKLKSSEQRELAQRRERQSAYLQDLKTSRTMQQQALKEYETNQKMILALIRRLEKQKEEEARKRALAGKRKKEPEVKEIAAKNKCWPLRGSVISRYGNQRHKILKTITRNLGIEIRGKRSDWVKAAAPGTVAMVTRIEGHGTGIIVDHGNSFYTVYGHVDNIRVREGDKVNRCQELGNPGDEDSMDGVKLYFQVSESTHTVDPMKWLEKAR